MRPVKATLNRVGLCLLLAVAINLSASMQEKQKAKTHSLDHNQPAVIWIDPGDIGKKDLFAGPGGEKDEPKLPVTFVKEDKHGHNSKFDVVDAGGKKWRAKLGIEAQPETVATRLLWAIGYFANENYYLRDLEVEKLPAHLQRGQGHVISPDHLDGVRLQRKKSKEDKSQQWDWQHNKFVGTREFNGLRVMMALISNWDLKDENNAVLLEENRQEWLVTDVGTALGASGTKLTESASKNNLKEFEHAKFIAKVTPEYVEFNFPRRPPLLHLFILPSYLHQIHMRWVGKHVPRADAKWVGTLLAQVSTKQFHDAFRAGGYSPEQADAFTRVLQARIAELNRL